MIESLDERFTQPEGWRWHRFTRESKRGKRLLRFGCVSPKGRTPYATIVCLPGLSEFGEKYFEVARWAIENNFSFWVLDWFGQGRSGRYLKNPHKRHANDFQDDVDDLNYFLMEYVKHASVSTDVGRIPFVMLAHSMGGTIGMHYMAQNPDFFSCAVFSAPMFGIQSLERLPLFIAKPISALLSFMMGNSYAYGGGDWSDVGAASSAELSSDPARNFLLTKWFIDDPELQTGFVTYGWVHAAIQSCAKLLRRGYLSSIQTHCTLAMAGEDRLVDNNAIKRIYERLDNADLKELPEAHHEILMERDDIRDCFLQFLHTSIEEHVINNPASVKKF